MPRLRQAAIAALTIAILSATTLIVAQVVGSPVERPRYFLFAASTAMASFVMLVCADLCVRTVLRSQTSLIAAVEHSQSDLVDKLVEECKALQRALLTYTEQYGDARAIDATLASERRHLVNRRAGQETVELTSAGKARSNVTPLRKQS